MAWLEGRPDVDPVVFAIRSAALVAPLVWARREASAEPGDRTTLFTCRALLTGWVVGQSAMLPDSTINVAVEAVAESSGVVRGEAKSAQFEREFAAEAMDTADAGTDAAARAEASRVYADSVAVQLSTNSAYEATLAAAAAATAAVPEARTASSYNGAARAAAAADFAAKAAASTGDLIWEQLRDDAGALEAGADMSRRALWTIFAPEFFRRAAGDFRLRWEADSIYAFWLRWWDGVTSGRQLPWPLQERVARIPNEVWMAGPKEVAEEIAKIEEESNAPRNPDVELSSALRAMDPPPQEIVRLVQSAIERNRATLPATFDAIEGLIVLEIAREQQRNHVDDLDVDEAKRRIAVFLNLYAAINQLRATVPATGPVSSAKAEKAEKTLRYLGRKLAELPKAKADEMVEGVWASAKGVTQVALILGCGALAATFGLPPLAGVAVGSFAFAPKNSADILKAARDYIAPGKSGS